RDKIDQNSSCLEKLASNSDQFASMVWVSKAAFDLLFNKPDPFFAQYIKQADNKQIVELFLFMYQLYDDALHYDNAAKNCPDIVQQIRQSLQNPEMISRLLSDETDSKTLLDFLPMLLKCFNVPRSGDGSTIELASNIAAVRQLIHSYMYTTSTTDPIDAGDKVTFSRYGFLTMLESATPEQLYALIICCRDARFGANQFQDNTTAQFISQFTHGSNFEAHLHYHHIIDKLLLHCNSEQLFNLISDSSVLSSLIVDRIYHHRVGFKLKDRNSAIVANLENQFGVNNEGQEGVDRIKSFMKSSSDEVNSRKLMNMLPLFTQSQFEQASPVNPRCYLRYCAIAIESPDILLMELNNNEEKAMTLINATKVGANGKLVYRTNPKMSVPEPLAKVIEGCQLHYLTHNIHYFRSFMRNICVKWNDTSLGMYFEYKNGEPVSSYDDRMLRNLHDCENVE
ncbi:MAG: hypothetical protein KDH94_07910, partial [Coxiellaceae bacterium]|nr:hypothetical protein [Coxiellaceae bacterium]